jgi:Restriction endonuclease EcoRV.
MTLGAFTGYFRQRDSRKNTKYPYNQYAGHFVLGVIYTKCDDVADERQQFALNDLEKIPSVIKDFQFFVQPKYKIASARPGSGNTKYWFRHKHRQVDQRHGAIRHVGRAGLR